MKKIEAIIRSFKLEEVRDTLQDAGVEGMTTEEVSGLGRLIRPVPGDDDAPVDFDRGMRIIVVVVDEHVECVIRALLESAKTGKPGDGKIFISNVEEAIRIRTEEMGEKALC